MIAILSAPYLADCNAVTESAADGFFTYMMRLLPVLVVANLPSSDITFSAGSVNPTGVVVGVVRTPNLEQPE